LIGDFGAPLVTLILSHLDTHFDFPETGAAA
jgi:hypothetical protein